MERNVKKVVIIGGGVSGMTAGIYLQKAGFQTEIYEKHTIAGGQCTGWKREGFFIDNCVHWLTGTREGSGLNRLWKDAGVLGEDVLLYKKEKFYSAELNGDKLTFWRDKERTRKELLALSPDDAEEINQLMDAVKMAESMTVPVEKPFDMMNPIDYVKMGISMADMGKVMKLYSKMDIRELASRFHHPLIRMAITDYMPPGYQAYAFVVSYATVTGGNGDIPRGGSLEMAMRMVKCYQKLGGMLYTGTEVEKVLVKGQKAEGILLADGKTVKADYVVCASDTSHTFTQLLDASYMPQELSKIYKERELYPVVSAFHVAFGIEGSFDEVKETHVFACRPITIGMRRTERMSVNNYSYEPDFAPKGKSIVQSMFVQTEEDYEYWMKLYQDKEAYHKKKAELSEEIEQRLIENYPQLKGRVRILDVWTPATYNRYCNAWNGAYMSFIVTRNAKSRTVPGKIKGLSNVMIASQWLMGPGGLPVAASTGKFAAQRIMKAEKIKL
ncbi:MAG: NAD(P)/FAD-dependent oxidoreductase [Lachnospiraceae bacterium]|nr:NAD(P)/FAD-dependent oxidoreductase [Lachnospiraceae bacterium]